MNKLKIQNFVYNPFFWFFFVVFCLGLCCAWSDYFILPYEDNFWIRCASIVTDIVLVLIGFAGSWAAVKFDSSQNIHNDE